MEVVEMGTCLTNGVELYYEVAGEGEALVFTHGASWDHAQWRPQMEHFQKNYRTVAWDVRGHGHSTLPDGEVDSEEFARDLIGLLDHLQIKKAHLCGLSMGGHISLQTAIRYPDRVISLALIGTPFTNVFNWYEKLLVPFNRFSNLFISMDWMASMQASMLSRFNPDNKRYIEQAVSNIPKTNWIRLWDAITRMESKEELAKVECPTLILYGDHDTMVQRQQEYMHRTIPFSILEVIPNAHHATNLDNPEAVNLAMEMFLRGIQQARSET
ncbi:alpha/beta fold hydrolase [Bacillus sp. OxB-1]|uniref:alpha/beta fold hydrolase n=1 Tax=Bacillus sp. (strain OxB-1) TaxID=98228 RepID=UPI000AF2F634